MIILCSMLVFVRAHFLQNCEVHRKFGDHSTLNLASIVLYSAAVEGEKEEIAVDFAKKNSR